MSLDYDTRDRASIRKHMRALRNQLSPQQQLAEAKKLSQLLFSLPAMQRAQNIAVYLANDGEIDPIVFSERALYRGKNCLLPSMHQLKKGHMEFGPYHGKRRENQFGIAEPDGKFNTMLQGKQLDVVLMPLVAFDAQGGRLGMGGGYYDRTFEFLQKSGVQKPKLIGLAHEFQQVAELPIESWDIPLDAIVTSKGIIKC